MVRDRLQELQQQQERRHSRAATELSVQSLEPAGDPFLDHVAQMHQLVDEIDRRIRAMLEVQETILGQTVVRPEDKQQLDTVIEEIHQRTGCLRPGLRQLELDLERQGAAADGGAQRRMRKNQCDQLRRRLNEVLERFNSAQEDYRERVNRRVRRQLELAGEQLSAAEVERLLEDKSLEIFFRRVSPTSFAAQTALEDASTRHSELLKLEQSVVELHECFVDMLHLVHSQGELVDRIETNVQSATDYIGQARVQMHQAVTYKKSAQRMKCVIVLIVVALMLLLLLLLAVLLGKFLPTGSH